MGTHDVKIRIGATDTASKIFKRVAIAAGAFLSLRVLGRAAKQSLNLFAEQEKATQKLEQAILATGGALGFTTQQMIEYAAELQNMTTISNESFETAISIMATFKNITGDAFKRSIELSADLSVALGTDLKGAVIQLGKALNDPAVGLSMLNRVGISFSETQKDLIKNLVEQNDLLGAQTIILDEISSQFGGQARKAIEGYSGAVDQMKNSWDDAKKAMGEFIATSDMLDVQGNIRLTTILIEDMATTWDLVTLAIQRAALAALSVSVAGAIISQTDVVKDARLRIEVKLLEAQTKLAENLAERERLRLGDVQGPPGSARAARARAEARQAAGRAGEFLDAERAVDVALEAWFGTATGSANEASAKKILDEMRDKFLQIPNVPPAILERERAARKTAADDIAKADAKDADRRRRIQNKAFAAGLRASEDQLIKDRREKDEREKDKRAAEERIRGARLGIGADESRFLTFGRKREDNSRRAVKLAEKAERNRIRQLAATERIADAVGGRELQTARIAITAFR